MSDKKLTYRTAYGELENIVQQLESEGTDLDQLSDLVKRANELVRFCQEKLRATENELEG